MKTTNTILSKEERDVLILATPHPQGKFLDTSEIGQRLGISASRVKILFHQACLKLGVRSRNEAVLLALKWGEIKPTDFWSVNEIAEIFKSLDHKMLINIANILYQELGNGKLQTRNEQTIPMCNRQEHKLIKNKELYRSCTKKKNPILTKEEVDVLALGAIHPDGKHLSNSEIGQCLGITVEKVKTIIYKACVKLGARNRNEAVLLALRRGEIKLTDFWSINDLAEAFSSLGSDMLGKIANIVDQGSNYKYSLTEDEQTVFIGRRPDSILKNSERDIVILVGTGLTNREIADRLCISVGSVGIFLNRACSKLGARNRSEAPLLALKQGEISAGEIYSFEELVELLAPLGSESIERMAQIVNQNLEQALNAKG